MGSGTFSFIISFWHDELVSATHLKVVQVDTGEEVQLSDGSFLLRISHADNASAERCLIRHLASGQEAYVQGGAKLRTFIKTCLLNNGVSGSATTNIVEE